MIARRVRVCHVITLLEPGGAQDNTLYTVSHLDAPFIPSLVCGRGGALDDEARRLGVPLRFVPSLVRPVRPHLDALALLSLARLFRQERPDIVHTHSSKAGILGRLAARLAGVSRVVHTIHGFGFHEWQRWPVRRAFIALERLAARLTTRFIAVSRANLETGVALGLFTRDRVSLIRSGVRLAEFERAAGIGGSRDAGSTFREEIGVPRSAPLVGRKGNSGNIQSGDAGPCRRSLDHEFAHNAKLRYRSSHCCGPDRGMTGCRRKSSDGVARLWRLLAFASSLTLLEQV